MRILCTFDCCSADGERSPAVYLLPSSDDKGNHIIWLPVCEAHAADWWDGADWDGRDLVKSLDFGD